MASRTREKHAYGTNEEDANWLNVDDTSGAVMAAIAWVLVLYCDFVVTYISLKSNWSYFIVIGYNVLVALSLWCHLMTMLTDPGAVVSWLFGMHNRWTYLEIQIGFAHSLTGSLPHSLPTLVTLPRQPRLARPLASSRDAGIPETIRGQS